VDSTAQTIILHPQLSRVSCGTSPTVLCVEGFSTDEYSSYNNVIAAGISNGATGVVDFTKNGGVWKVAFGVTSIGSTVYGVVALAPSSEILQSSSDVQNQIDSVITNQVIIFIITIVLLAIFVFVFSTGSEPSRTHSPTIQSLTQLSLTHNLIAHSLPQSIN
jgi:hypothetical protein